MLLKNLILILSSSILSAFSVRLLIRLIRVFHYSVSYPNSPNQKKQTCSRDSKSDSADNNFIFTCIHQGTSRQIILFRGKPRQQNTVFLREPFPSAPATIEALVEGVENAPLIFPRQCRPVAQAGDKSMACIYLIAVGLPLVIVYSGCLDNLRKRPVVLRQVSVQAV